MTSVTYGMRKSLCNVRFDMYQGADREFEAVVAYLQDNRHLDRLSNRWITCLQTDQERSHEPKVLGKAARVEHNIYSSIFLIRSRLASAAVALAS
jgi:hypothetical protein